jgi:hypothetical protein
MSRRKTEEYVDYHRKGCIDRGNQPEIVGNHIKNSARLFNGTEEDKQEFLLKIINREIKDAFGCDINVPTMLKAFDKYDELDVRRDEKKGSQGSVINVVISNQGTSFDDSAFKKIDEERDNK